MYRIGIDVGGTFTDVTLLNSETGRYYTYKLSSTLQDQSLAIARKRLSSTAFRSAKSNTSATARPSPRT